MLKNVKSFFTWILDGYDQVPKQTGLEEKLQTKLRKMPQYLKRRAEN